MDWVISRNSHVESAPSARTVQVRSFNTIEWGIRAIGVLWGGIFLVLFLAAAAAAVVAVVVVVGGGVGVGVILDTKRGCDIGILA